MRSSHNEGGQNSTSTSSFFWGAHRSSRARAGLATAGLSGRPAAALALGQPRARTHSNLDEPHRSYHLTVDRIIPHSTRAIGGQSERSFYESRRCHADDSPAARRPPSTRHPRAPASTWRCCDCSARSRQGHRGSERGTTRRPRRRRTSWPLRSAKRSRAASCSQAAAPSDLWHSGHLRPASSSFRAAGPHAITGAPASRLTRSTCVATS